MNFRKMLKKTIKLNFDQYFVFIFCLILSVLFFFVELTLYNSYAIVSMQGNIFILPSIAVFNTALWNIFMYISFIKCRQKEFTTFLTLGMTCSELKILLVIENILIFIIYIPIGLILGIVFSKIIVLFIFKLAGIHVFSFKIEKIFYIITIGYSALLTAIFILWTFRFVDNLSLSNTTKQDNFYALASKKGKLLKALLFTLIISYINFNERNVVSFPFKYYVDYCLICIISVYALCSAFVRIFTTYVKKRKKLYYKKILLINEIEDSLKRNKITIFFISFLNITFIISHRVYDLPNIKMLFPVYNFFKGSSFNLIYIFIVLLSFITSANILYFKMKIDLYNWQPKKNKLHTIGLIDEEINAILAYKLKIIFFSHVFLTVLSSISYIYILNINIHFIINTVKILICYFIIQLLGYIITKHKLKLI
ncbi:hypothetical protein [Clostridium sp. JS66]|uniref:hypothetical protein n=1 Tax=Clostridium sp. JS66 TaxID=3064705 RepID=UPI00298DD65A|nr:hypothetical protein [Clostridium sp. JS66]WPC39510.1 hypothetical protein Q6H37_16490 [Clostridium sp. JS66]